jgi:hypothetical protein
MKGRISRDWCQRSHKISLGSKGFLEIVQHVWTVWTCPFKKKNLHTSKQSKERSVSNSLTGSPVIYVIQAWPRRDPQMLLSKLKKVVCILSAAHQPDYYPGQYGVWKSIICISLPWWKVSKSQYISNDRSATCQVRNFGAGLFASMDVLRQNFGFTQFMLAY